MMKNDLIIGLLTAVVLFFFFYALHRAVFQYEEPSSVYYNGKEYVLTK